MHKYSRSIAGCRIEVCIVRSRCIAKPSLPSSPPLPAPAPAAASHPSREPGLAPQIPDPPQQARILAIAALHSSQREMPSPIHAPVVSSPLAGGDGARNRYPTPSPSASPAGMRSPKAVPARVRKPRASPRSSHGSGASGTSAAGATALSMPPPGLVPASAIAGTKTEHKTRHARFIGIGELRTLNFWQSLIAEVSLRKPHIEREA
jgi:hypothetical protein